MRGPIIDRVLKDERGGVVTTLVLLIIPMLLLGMINLTENTNILRGSNTTLQNAVTVMARHPAMMVNPDSQAKGDPLIAHKKAFNTFLDEFQYTLGNHIDNTSTTIDTSTIKYWFLVYNGRHTYQSIGFDGSGNISEGGSVAYDSDNASINQVYSYAFYSNVEGSVNYFGNDISGFPKTVYVSSNGITDTRDNAASDNVKVTLKEPGVLVVLNADINSLITEKDENVTRWAFAKIVTYDEGGAD